MPFYLYQHPQTKKTIEVMQSMNDEHVFVDSEGVRWERVFLSPAAKIDSMTYCNPFSKEDFARRTARPGMTMGDMWDESANLSEKRVKILGKDPLKEKAKAAYTKRTGKPHPNA
jgi:hypothetical protein